MQSAVAVATFGTSFWPALAAAAIASLLTGIFVGLALLYTQRRLDRTETRRAYLRDLSLTTQELRAAISRPNPFIITNAISSMPQPVKAAMEVINKRPISLWSDELKEQRELLDALHRLQLEYWDFQKHANDFDFRLRQFTRRFNAARNAIEANDPEVHSFCFGRLCGLETEQILPWLDLQLTPPAWLDPAFVDAAADEQITRARDAYLQSRSRLNQAFQSVEQILAS